MKPFHLLFGLLCIFGLFACPGARQLNKPEEPTNETTRETVSTTPQTETEGDGRIAFIRIKEGAVTGNALPQYKYETARAVYKKLIDARGIRLEEPEFVMTPHLQYVAWMDFNQLEIGLEERAYDVCATFEDSLSALAALLGHEISHYYEKHSWKAQFTSGFGSRLEITDDLSRLDEGARNETEADILGGFLAYSAGYQPYNIMPQVLSKMYQSYGRPEQIDGYPSLSDRKKLAEISQGMLLNLIEIFDTGNLLLAVGEYDWARDYFQFMLKQNYRGREIFNNLGVLTAMQAMKYFAEKPLHYPFQLDLETRISRGQGLSREQGVVLMRDAIDYFDKAASLDREYGPALLNRAAAHAFLEEYMDAEFYANKAFQISQQQGDNALEAGVRSLRGVMTYSQDETQKEAALAHFRAAAALGDAAAVLNIQTLEKGDLQVRAPLGEAAVVKESIGGLKLDTYYSVLNPPRVDAQIPLSAEELFQSKVLDDGQSKLLMHLGNEALGPTPKILFQVTEPGLSLETTKGIGPGDTRADILNAYGPPHREISTTRGGIIVYNGLMFFMNNAGVVERWVVYDKQVD